MDKALDTGRVHMAAMGAHLATRALTPDRSKGGLIAALFSALFKELTMINSAYYLGLIYLINACARKVLCVVKYQGLNVFKSKHFNGILM